MLRDDIIILTAVEAHSERSTRFTQAAQTILAEGTVKSCVTIGPIS